ncbi:MAG: hypothetical protein MHMPM18_004903, partial [Marteilia pararefringens]
DEEDSDLDMFSEQSINETQDFDISICNIELINIDKFILAVMKEKLRVGNYNEEYRSKTYNACQLDIDSEMLIISFICRWPHIFYLKALVLDFEIREKRSPEAISNFIEKVIGRYCLDEIFCSMGMLANNAGGVESPVALIDNDESSKYIH